jgi:drug/metabolite transporter (DMT)-like permease
MNHESSIQMSNIAPIGFSLSTTAAWGAANFLGGYASRRVNPFLLATIADLSGLAFMILVATTVHAPIPSKHALTWSLVAGSAGGLALAIFYGSLSSGKMGLAAPVAGVLSAGIPAIATMFREGSPGASRLIGFALATLGVWLISRSDDKTERKVLGMAILAGCGFAAYALAIKQAGPGSPMWIEVYSRTAALFVTAAITVYGRKLVDFRQSSSLLGVVVGLVDVSGSVAFVRATQLGRLDTVVVLSSLHPAVTVLLALVLLKEKLTPWKAVGVCAALVAVPLIAG